MIPIIYNIKVVGSREFEDQNDAVREFKDSISADRPVRFWWLMTPFHKIQKMDHCRSILVTIDAVTGSREFEIL
jgi:hypothetical protein